MDAKQLCELGMDLFSKKSPLTSLHQEIADNFYPERADFTVTRSLGDDFAAHLMTSWPLQARRSLGDQIGVMLRPTARPWFHTGLKHAPRITDNETKAHLQWFEETQRRAMYDKDALFTRATKEGDHDFAAFGQTAISVELNSRKGALLYRCWHLRDMAWQENEDGRIGLVFRKWKPTALTMKRLWPTKIHQEVGKLAEKTPFETVEVMHMVVDADLYDDKAAGKPRWSIWWDCTHSTLIEATPIWNRCYVIPRWQTVSGSQYSYSPAAVAGLPDARLIQAMTFTLLEAGEKATSPPMVAVQDVVKSDMALYAGGVTYIDPDYDERTGEALRPITQDFRGFNFGLEMTAQQRVAIESAFFLNKLKPFNPASDPQMTAFQAGQIMQEYIRNALPIFEPMEMEYNGELCDETFEVLWRAGTFGDPRDWPRSMRGAEVSFTFESPLHDAIEQQKGQKYLEAQQLIGQAVALDPSLVAVPKAEVALRDALNGIGVPARWLNSESHVEQSRAKAQQAQQQAQQLAAMQTGSEVVKNLSAAVPQPAAAAAVPA